MKLEFIGPASLLENGNVSFPALLDAKPMQCVFSFEALQDLDLDGVEKDSCVYSRTIS